MQKRRTPFYTARKAAGLSQAQVSNRSGVAQQTISELERGLNINPTWDILSRLSQVLGVRPDQLLPPTKLPPKRELKAAKRPLASAQIIATPLYRVEAAL